MDENKESNYKSIVKTDISSNKRYNTSDQGVQLSKSTDNYIKEKEIINIENYTHHKMKLFFPFIAEVN
jgi:hypothetical protein